MWYGYMFSSLIICLLLTSSQAQVPLSLKKWITQLSREEFIDHFLRLPETDPLANNASETGEQDQQLSGSGRISPNVRDTMLSNVVQPDLCSPHPVTVEVPPDPDPNVIRFPTCILMERCAGCSGTEHEECAPVDITYVAKVVLVSRYSHRGSSPFDYSNMKTIYMEQHLSCETRCRVQPHDCNYNVHSKHDDDLCRCVCRNAHEESTCVLPKRWDDKRCECVCPTVVNCDSRQYAFNTDTCSCERRSLSSASSLGLHSSANDPSGDPGTGEGGELDTRGLDESTLRRLRGMVDGGNNNTGPQTAGSTSEAVTTTQVPTTTETTTVTTTTEATTTTTAETTTHGDPCAHKECAPYWQPALLESGQCGCEPTFDIFAGFPGKRRK